MIGADLLRFDKQQKYLVADVEAESLNLARARPFQLSFSTFTLDNDLEEHSFYIDWPDLNMSKGAAAITRFDFNHYKTNAINAKTVLDKFESYLLDDQYILVWQNFLGYDLMIYNSWRRALGLSKNKDFIKTPWKFIDTDALSRMMLKEIKPDLSSPESFLACQYKVINHIEKGLKTNLTAIAQRFKLDFDFTQAHEAMFDVRVNKAIFREQVKIMEL